MSEVTSGCGAGAKVGGLARRFTWPRQLLHAPVEFPSPLRTDKNSLRAGSSDTGRPGIQKARDAANFNRCAVIGGAIGVDEIDVLRAEVGDEQLRTTGAALRNVDWAGGNADGEVGLRWWMLDPTSASTTSATGGCGDRNQDEKNLKSARVPKHGQTPERRSGASEETDGRLPVSFLVRGKHLRQI